MLFSRYKHLFVIPIVVILLSRSAETKMFSKIFKMTKSPIIGSLDTVNQRVQKTVLRTDVSLNERILYNFYVVEDRKLYRCAQLPHDVLNNYMKQFGIKTVVCLRGEHPEEDWWRREKAVVERRGGKFFSISMNAGNMTSKSKLIKLLDIYDSAPRPILIHCRAGADRTGEAAALWVLEQQKKSYSEAAKQLAFIPYHHRQTAYPAKDYLIKIWRGRKWLEQEYDAQNYPKFHADKN